ncbi:hypothetical protein OAV88_02205 [bacterium]|nr:hypothetical protein [bacterium]
MFGSYYLAASCTCQHPYDWIFKVFTCREGSSSTWLRVDSNGRPLCTDVCSPMTVDLIAGMLLTNVFLCIFWYVGEYLIAAFDKELRSELKGGEEWQLDLDEQERNHGLVPATVRRKAPIKHSWKWNEELLGWQERKNKANAEYKHKLWMRAYFFYAFFFCVSWLNQWLVLEIMPVVCACASSLSLSVITHSHTHTHTHTRITPT